MAVVPFSSQVSKGRMDLAVTAGLEDVRGSWEPLLTLLLRGSKPKQGTSWVSHIYDLIALWKSAYFQASSFWSRTSQKLFTEPGTAVHCGVLFELWCADTWFIWNSFITCYGAWWCLPCARVKEPSREEAGWDFVKLWPWWWLRPAGLLGLPQPPARTQTSLSVGRWKQCQETPDPN